MQPLRNKFGHIFNTPLSRSVLCPPSRRLHTDAQDYINGMRTGLGVCLLTLGAVAVTLTLAASTSAASYPGPRNKPRTIRGFKNVALSTARGFGKRGFPTLELLTAGDNEEHTDSLPNEWFVEELSRSPELARMIVDKFLDINQDGQLSADELLRPVY